MAQFDDLADGQVLEMQPIFGDRIGHLLALYVNLCFALFGGARQPGSGRRRKPFLGGGESLGLEVCTPAALWAHEKARQNSGPFHYQSCVAFAGISTPLCAYSRSLLRIVLIEMPRTFAACVLFPSVCRKVARMRSRSTSATGSPTRASVASGSGSKKYLSMSYIVAAF